MDFSRIHGPEYGVTKISRFLEMIGLFCRIYSLSQGSFAKETCNSKEPTNGSHHIGVMDMSASYLTYEYGEPFEVSQSG